MALALEKKWTLYYWFDGEWTKLHEIGTGIDTIKKFWTLYNNLPPLSNTIKSNFAFFHSGILPQWEEPRNIDGGKWSWIYCSSDIYTMQNDWLTILLSLIGETLLEPSEEENKINGAVVSVRNAGTRMSVWTTTTAGQKQNFVGLGKKLQMLLAKKNDVVFKCHRDAIQYNSFYNTNSSHKIIYKSPTFAQPKAPCLVANKTTKNFNGHKKRVVTFAS